MKCTRKIIFSDVYKIAQIINAAGVTVKDVVEMTQSENIRDLLQKDPDKAHEELGVRFINYIIERAPSAEAEINEFLAALAGRTPAEISQAGVIEIAELIGDIFRQNEDLKNIFAVKSSEIETTEA